MGAYTGASTGTLALLTTGAGAGPGVGVQSQSDSGAGTCQSLLQSHCDGLTVEVDVDTEGSASDGVEGFSPAKYLSVRKPAHVCTSLVRRGQHPMCIAAVLGLT